MTRVASTGVLLAMLGAARPGHADRYEAQLGAHAIGGMARVAEKAAPDADTVPAAGVGARLSYGLRNWLAIEGDVSVANLGEAEYRDMAVSIAGGPPRPGDLTRTTRTARFVAGALLRGGVAWVPTAYLGAGVQGRWQGAAVFSTTGTAPDGYGDELAVDLVATARIGLERRLGRRSGIRCDGRAPEAWSPYETCRWRDASRGSAACHTLPRVPSHLGPGPRERAVMARRQALCRPALRGPDTEPLCSSPLVPRPMAT
jgi:hypothetical protein